MLKKIPYNKQITVPYIFILLFTSFGSMAQVGIATTTPLSTFEVNGSNGQSIITVSSDLTLDATHSVIVCNNGAVPKTITLPTPVGIKGRIYNIKRSESSSANITIATSSSQMIDGEPNIILSHAKESISLISDGADWKVIGTYLPQLPIGEISYFDTAGTIVAINSPTTDGNSNMFLCNPNTVLSSNSIGFNMLENGKIQYTGTTTRSFRISATISAIPDTSGSFVYEFKKTNTNFLLNSRVIQNLSSSEIQTSTIQVFVTLAPNDYIELWMGKIGGTANVTIKSLNLFAFGI